MPGTSSEPISSRLNDQSTPTKAGQELLSAHRVCIENSDPLPDCRLATHLRGASASKAMARPKGWENMEISTQEPPPISTE